jgi:DNA-binding NarL/FixJ family response regulator
LQKRCDFGNLRTDQANRVPKRILIVDDNEVVRYTLRNFLSREGDVEVCGEAVSGREAIEKALELKPDLIVMDQRMPISDGLQTAQKMRTMQISAPIILFTIFAESIPAHLVQAAGVNVVVGKTDVRGLLRHIENLLANGSQA